LLKEWREFTVAVNNTLDPDHIAIDPEENQVAANHSEPSIRANLGPKLIDQRISADLLEGLTNLLNEGDSATRIVFSNPIGNRFQVALDEA
jgi:hypothetical protein